MVSIKVIPIDEGKRYLIEARGPDLYGNVKFAVWQTGRSPEWYTPIKGEGQYYYLNYLPNAGRGKEYNVHIYCDNDYIDEATFDVALRHPRH